VLLLIHRFEDRKPTNTGRLATECLPNSEVLVRGVPGRPSEPIASTPDRQTLLLFPHEGAHPLAEFAGLEKPVTLVVPDGNWRQAFKTRKRVPGLSEMPCVSLANGPESTYRLRAESHADGLATFEAIARALGILEGAHVQTALERVFAIAVERTLWARGMIGPGDVTGGVPAGAKRHDPTSGIR
jgi:DTW domain-containing protein YfiP